MVKIKATFPNPRRLLWPGEFVNARALLETRRSQVVIPGAAVQRGPGGLFAYVVRPDSTVEARPLRIADESGELVAVDAGLKEGEQVVTSNQYRLQPDARVRSGGDAAPAQPAAGAAKGAP